MTRRASLLALLAIVTLSLGEVACAAETANVRNAEKLYFSLELRSGGKLVGQPKLLGESGRWVRAEKRPDGSDVADYALSLLPTNEGRDAYRVVLDVNLPAAGADGHRELALLHGEVKKLQLGRQPGDLEVELMLMKVDSPEFRALMNLPDPEKGPNAI